MTSQGGARIHITGVVQGVGFRPFVYGLATRLALTGWVCNTSAGVDIEVDGAPESLTTFVHTLRQHPPPLAHIAELHQTERAPNGYTSFEIIPSQSLPNLGQPVSPDIAICADCLRELFDPHDRRYHYPFSNCTNCGPRFTIIQAMPYDRPTTTMAAFPMCPACAAEYADPLNRRFHAQPIACPACGPQVWLEVKNQRFQAWVSAHQSPVNQARALLRQGAIVAIKGLGGFHLVCDATHPDAVAELRRRKLRANKPFALMMPSLAAVETHCWLSEAERTLLTSNERPIVLLQGRSASALARAVAPGQNSLGVMLPYTPLHYLLLEQAAGFPEALVMTSGNLSEEPIVTDNAEARERLAPLADAFLMHDRDIYVRCDDSVVRSLDSQAVLTSSPSSSIGSYSLTTVLARRSRGYAPLPVCLPCEAPPLLAVGAELKNTFGLARGREVYLSQHIGNLENYETLCAFERGATHFEQLFCIRPQALAHDLHPDYLSTRYAQHRAEQEGLPTFGIQHHHAHIAACMADNVLVGNRPVIGVAFDGTGYGDDGAIWGGEFLLADYLTYQRLFHLDYIPLPGGEAAVREPWRLALAWLNRAGIDWAEHLPPVRHALAHDHASRSGLEVLRRQLHTHLNSPPTSSVGRLFDAVAALIGVCQQVSYEAQAAIELEALVAPRERGIYPLDIHDQLIDPAPMISTIVEESLAGLPAGIIAARFHNSLAQLVSRACGLIREQWGISEVALSGGVWQNITLLGRTVGSLRKNGFQVYLHHQVPPNDGGLALGQASIAAHRLREWAA